MPPLKRCPPLRKLRYWQSLTILPIIWDYVKCLPFVSGIATSLTHAFPSAFNIRTRRRLWLTAHSKVLRLSRIYFYVRKRNVPPAGRWKPFLQGISVFFYLQGYTEQGIFLNYFFVCPALAYKKSTTFRLWKNGFHLQGLPSVEFAFCVTTQGKGERGNLVFPSPL